MPNLSSTLDPELFQSVLPMHNQPVNSIRASVDGNLRGYNNNNGVGNRGNIPSNNNNNFNRMKQLPGDNNFKGRFPNKKVNHHHPSKFRTERKNYNNNNMSNINN